MKPINILSLVNAKRRLSPTVLDYYLKNFDIQIKNSEFEDIASLVKELLNQSQGIDVLDEFYVGYTINQISKEFDLLRFGNKCIINIELKKKNTGEKIKKQLIKNKYYLSFLKLNVLNFTYVVEDNKLYFLDESETLNETDFSFLFSKLNEQILLEIDDIDDLFDPSNYLVSPFNSTNAFISGQYFLTDHQKNIKKDILNLSTKTGCCFISIEGSAGTGKTLLTYDIAKEYINNKKNVLILHCGSLNDGQHYLRSKYNWSIEPTKNYVKYNLKDYDLIIIDEVQRIDNIELDKILGNIKNTNIKCIFSYDSQQCLASWEIKRNIPEYIKSQVSPHLFKLTEKVRTNKEIASFIKNLFNKNRIKTNQEYSNVNVQYFSTIKGAKAYMDILRDRGWKIINYTPSKYTKYPYDSYQYLWDESAHKVIGQEFDKVVAVIDKFFYYNENGAISTHGWSSSPYYHPTKMLFQIVTRTRKKLNLIIIDNEEVLDHCLKILQNKHIEK